MNRKLFGFCMSEDSKSIYPKNLYTFLIMSGWDELAEKVGNKNDYQDKNTHWHYDGKGKLSLFPIKPVECIIVSFTVGKDNELLIDKP